VLRLALLCTEQWREISPAVKDADNLNEVAGAEIVDTHLGKSFDGPGAKPG
jgi:hypothetical protein